MKRLILPSRSGFGTANNPLAKLEFHPKKGDEVWTKAQWINLLLHLHGGNDPKHFVMGFRDKDDCKRYVRSKTLSVHRAITWAWSSIVGKAKSPLAFTPFSANSRRQSCWGAMDFDAHDGNEARAEELALAAFRLLLAKVSDFAIILERSGSGGWHVWIISVDSFDIAEWIQLLKQVASTIGAQIVDGVCEIFPPDSAGGGFSKGLRAPGCWNPSTGRCNEIVWENTHTALSSVLSGKSKIQPLSASTLQDDFPDTERNYSFSSPIYQYWLSQFAITQTSTRNQMLCKLTGHLFRQAGRSIARRLAELQYDQKTVPTRATKSEHMEAFDALWSGMNESWQAELSPAARTAFASLQTDNERDAFRIVRSFARKAVLDGATDFPIARNNLGERLGLTGKGAAYIRDKFVVLGIIAKTADYVPNKAAARFNWIDQNGGSLRSISDTE